MYGCEGWKRDDPEASDSCQVSGPLPGRGYDLWRLEERCSICGEMPRLTVKGFRGRPWKLCLNDQCPSMIEMQQKRAEREAARNAAKAMKKAADKAEAAGEGAGAGEGAEPKPTRADTRTRRRKRARTPSKT
jgi:hypothetical protein